MPQSAPGLPGVTLARVNGLTINDLGTWVFHGVLAGTGVTVDNDGSVWSNRDGSLTLEYREGGAAPLEGYSFSSMPYPALNNDNALCITGSNVLTPPGTTPTKLGVFVETKGVL